MGMKAPRSLLVGILITVAVGSAVGRILSTQLVFEPSLHRDDKDPEDRRRLWPKTRPAQMPTFSSNDRSRWATVRALVDHGTYVIGRRSQGMVLFSAGASVANVNPLAAVVTAQAAYYARLGRDSGIIFEDGWQSVDKVLHPAKLEF